MITLFVEENNPLTQYFYNKSINNIQFHQLTCPSCGNSGCLSVHGYYYRSVKTSSGKNKLRICRIICECCSHTHAILLSSIVPYSQTSAAEQISIIDNYETHQPLERAPSVREAESVSGLKDYTIVLPVLF